MASASLWFTLGTAGMLLGSLALVVGHFRLGGQNRRRYALLVLVPVIALVAYLLMALDLGALTGARENVVWLPRYVDWLLTTPIHVVYVGLLAGAARRDIGVAAILQGATIALGFGGAIAPTPLSWLLYLAGSAAFVGVIYYAYGAFDDAARARPDGVTDLFRKLRAFMIVLWLIYPVIWLVAPSGIGVMDTETTALVVSYIDVVAKVGFGLIALNGTASVLADAGGAAAEPESDGSAEPAPSPAD